MSLNCCDCGANIRRKGAQGRNPKRCKPCRLSFRAKSCRVGPQARHSTKCRQCHLGFSSSRANQLFCSQACFHQSRRKRDVVTCGNALCGKKFVQRPCEQKRFCSLKCLGEHKKMRRGICRNPECKKPMPRAVSSSCKKFGRDYGKYCCRDCFFNHRWGTNRPSRKSSLLEVGTASRRSLATSLRRKCKILGVPFDRECTREAVCERDKWTCQMCGVKCSKEHNGKNRRPLRNGAEHDHIVALTNQQSPGNVFPNSQCLCRKCNNKKRAKSWGQFRLDLERSVQRWESAARSQRQQNSRSSAATQAAAL